MDVGWVEDYSQPPKKVISLLTNPTKYIEYSGCPFETGDWNCTVNTPNAHMVALRLLPIALDLLCNWLSTYSHDHVHRKCHPILSLQDGFSEQVSEYLM